MLSLFHSMVDDFKVPSCVSNDIAMATVEP